MEKPATFTLAIVLGGLLLCAEALGGSIYKCKTPQGTTFSQTPCAKDAVRLDRERTRTSQPAAETPVPQAGEAVDIGTVGTLGNGTVEEIVALLGEPAARYTKDGTQHWFYPNATDGKAPEPVFAEMLIDDGRMFQINWLPGDVMQRSVASARRFAGWQQPARITEKDFSAADTDVVGRSKADITARFGQPDVKKVYNGSEWWEYRKVRLAPDSAQMLTIYFEFENDKVVGSVGN